MTAAKPSLSAKMHFAWGQSCAYWGNKTLSKTLYRWAVNAFTRAAAAAPDWPPPVLRRAVIRGRELDDYAGAVRDLTAVPQSHLRTFPLRVSSVRRDYIKNVNLSLLKDIHVRESMRVQLRFETVNAFNEPYFIGPVVNPATPATFGQIVAGNQENYARRVQLGAKFIF